MAFFPKLKDDLLRALSSPFVLITWLWKRYEDFKSSFLSFFQHFKILREANISLGKYHLLCGNFKDAKFRFWLTNKFFAPNDPENNYWYAWVNIFTKDFKGAIEKLKNNSFDKIGLSDYITNMNAVSTIPEEIETEYNLIEEEFKLDKYSSEKINAFQAFMNALAPYITKLPWEAKMGKYTVLEIGTYPFLMEELMKNFPESSQIDGLNFTSVRSKEAKSYNEKSKIYHELITSKKGDFASDISLKYELIIAVNSLPYSAVLKDNFKIIKRLLTDDGHFAFLVPKGYSTKLEPENNHFAYTQKYITDQLTLAEFESMSITTINISKNYEFFVVIAK